MAKNSIRDFSATAGSNTDIQSVNIDENCPASGINNAIRELMVDLKNVSTGAINLETPAADSLTVAGDLTVDTNTLKVDSSNNRVGIGLATPEQLLHLRNASGNCVAVLGQFGTGTKATITAASNQVELKADSGTNDVMTFKTGSSERVRIDSSGHVGIGATPSVPFEVKKENAGFQAILDNDNGSAKGLKVRIKANDSGDFPIFQAVSASSGSDVEVFTINDDGRVTVTEQIQFGTDAQTKITGGGTSDADLILSGDTNIRFETGTNERARIDSNGNLIIGATQQSGPDGGNATGIVAAHNGRFYISSLNGANVFEFNVTGTGGVGSIHVNSSGTAYNTSSDYRLKRGVEDMTGAIDRVKALAPKRFQFIADPDTTVDGFLAHEAQTVVPEAITGTHNEVKTWTQQEIDDGDAPDGTSAGDNKLDGDGKTIPVMQGIDQSKLVPLLTGALQEAIAKIETLETEMTALKARVTALEA